MRKVTCRDCKKHYDYDEDAFCPKCGSYNPPANAGSTQMEREMLSRFDRGRSRQNERQERQPEAARPAVTRPARPTGAAQEADGRRHSTRVEDCASCAPGMNRPKGFVGNSRQRQQQQSGGFSKILGIIVAIIFIVNFLIPVIANIFFRLY